MLDGAKPFHEQLYDLAKEMSCDEWSRRAETVPSLSSCPECGGQPLRLAGSNDVRCRCGWTGVVLRRLP